MAKKTATARKGPRLYAEHHPQGTRLVWPEAPMCRTSANGQRRAPSLTGQVTMIISGSAIVRFDLPDGRVSEPRQPVSGQPCEVLVKEDE